MSFARYLLAPLTGAVLGTAVWVSMGVMDQLPMDGRMTRVALLPSWAVLAGLVVAAGLLLSGLQRLIGTRSDPGRGEAASDWMLPLLALSVLVVPYLPWIADRWPVWQVLAGPFRWLVWATVGGQLAWVAWQHGWIRGPRMSAVSGRATALVWLAVVAASGASAWRLTNTPIFPTGDEPHYLVIAQSLWRDGDLKIENNHEREDYQEYFAGSLAPHYLTRGVDGEIYSVHPIGVPILVAPVYAAGGYPLVVFLYVLISATAVTLVWRAGAGWLGQRSAAIFGSAAIVASAPFLLNTLTIYPEIPAALAVALAFTMTLGAPTSGTRVREWRWLASGAAVATLPWLSTKYAPMSAALVLVLLARQWIRWTPVLRVAPPAGAWRSGALVVLPYAASLAAWFAFFQAYWGSPWPGGPYGTLTQTSPANLLFGAPGMFFDQEYGVLAYAPVLFLAVPGLWTMARRGGEERRAAVEILLVFGALLGTVGAFRIWWGGSAVVGRPIVSGLALLLLPIAVQFAAAPAGSARRAAQHLLVWIGAAITATLVIAEGGWLLANQRDGSSTLLTWLSPHWELWSRVPTFVQGHTDIMAAWVQSLAWVAIAIVAGQVLARVRPRAAGEASLAALVTLSAGLLAGVGLMPLLPDPVEHSSADLHARSTLVALQGFDRDQRPLGLVYDPLRVADLDEVRKGLVLEVEPGQRTAAQPVPLLHNGRFSLPAGRYRAAVRWTADAHAFTTPLALQVGRIGLPWRSWIVTPNAGGLWEAEFELPVDARLVGFRDSPDLARVVASITLQALAVVDRSDRPSTPEVMGSKDYGHASVFFHDDLTSAEPSGFWVYGARETTVTVATRAPNSRLRLHVHSGGHANRVVFAAPGWSRTLDLLPGITEEVDLPESLDSVFVMKVIAEDGFVPAESDPTSTDRRLLGAWIEIVPGD